MIDIEDLAAQVKRNCNISDANHWGNYSLCGLLIRLREMYRAEHGIRPWEKIRQEDAGEWITAREALWRQLEGKEYERIAVNGNVYGPFDVGQLNAKLSEEGLIYGAGLGLHLKPSFFLADLVSRERMEGFDVFTSGAEYARDLSEYPAMLQDGSIFARTEPTRLLLWQRFEEMRCKRTQCALTFAFSKYGVSAEEEPSEDVDRKISSIARSEVETYIHHELGEASEGERMGEQWKKLLARLSHSRAELFSRSVKDILSDTSDRGMLSFIEENRKEGSLGFYMAFLSGFRKVIFPEIVDAFRIFVETGDWQGIEDARKRGYKKAEGYAGKLLSLYRNHKDDAALSGAIETELLKGLL